MKKLLALLLMLVLVLSLTGCDMAGSLTPLNKGETPGISQQNPGDHTGKKMTQQEREAALAELDNYWDKLRLEWTWDQEDAEGCVGDRVCHRLRPGHPAGSHC